MKWELIRTLIQSGVEADKARLSSLLDDGWEPFAASPAGQIGDVYYLRRQVNAYPYNEEN